MATKGKGLKIHTCKASGISAYTGGCMPDVTTAMDRLKGQVLHKIRKN